MTLPWIARGVVAGEVSEAVKVYVPRAAHCDKISFEQGAWRACFSLNQQETSESAHCASAQVLVDCSGFTRYQIGAFNGKRR